MGRRRPRARAERRLTPRETLATIGAVEHGLGLWCWVAVDTARPCAIFLLTSSEAVPPDPPPGVRLYRVPILFAELSEPELAVVLTLPRGRWMLPPTHRAPPGSVLLELSAPDWLIFGHATARFCHWRPAPPAALARAARALERRAPR